MKIYQKTCTMCGRPFEYTALNNRRMYCNECQVEVRRNTSRNAKRRLKERMLAKEREIKMRNSSEIWGYSPSDYAEKQKRETLERLGRIEVK